MSNTNDPNRPAAPQPSQQSEVRIRRAPKLPAFLIVGGGLGAIVAFVLTALFPVDPEVGFAALFGYLALYGITAGVVVGGVIAIVLDRRADKRSTLGSAVVETETAPRAFESQPSSEVPSSSEIPSAPGDKPAPITDEIRSPRNDQMGA